MYSRKGLLVFLLFLAMVLLATVALRAQNARRITGTVKDKAGEPLAGAAVVVKDGTSKNYTVSGPDGKYTLNMAAATDKTVIEFTFMGMKPHAVTIGKRTVIDVIMEQDGLAIDEIVISAGYGVVQERADMTGSAFQVTGEQIAKMPAARIDNLLSGLVPGVSIEEGSASVRTRYNTRVRGDASLSASSEPLWIIDGVPVYTGEKTNMVSGTSFTVSPLSFLNPEDIASMTVLKDASTTALYGADGANGVIIVTTKQGRQEKVSLHTSLRYSGTGIDNSTRLRWMTAAQWWDYATEAWLNATGANGKYRTMETFPYRDNEHNSYSATQTNWYDVYTRPGRIMQVNLAASGGNAQMNHYISGSYFKEHSTNIGDTQERISLRAKTRYQFGKKITATINLSGSYNKNNLFSAGSYAFKTLPIFSPYDEDGVTPRLYNWYSTSEIAYDPKPYKFTNNEVPTRQFSDNTQHSFASDGTVALSYEPVRGLTITTQEGYNIMNINENIYHAKTTLNGYSDGIAQGYSRRAGVFSLTWNSINRLNFNRSFGKHKIGALAGIELVHKEYRTLNATGRGFANDQIKEVGYAHIDSRDGYSSAKLTRSLSYLGQLSYAYDNRFFLSLTARRQGYSSFSRHTRFGNFAAVGISWNLHNEHWFNSNIINTLKLKASYGNSGNSRVDTSASYGAYSYSEGTYYGGVMGATQSSAPNPGLSWENTYITNLGLSVGFWKRLSIEVEAYSKYTKNLLYDGRVSSVITDDSVTRNVGEIRNDGIEVTLSSENVKTSDFSWSTEINVSHNRNTIVKLYKGMHTGFFTSVWMEGESKDSWWLVRWAGVDPSTGAPMWYDANGNISFSFSYNNRVVNKNYRKTPTLEGGMVNNLQWKDFSLRLQTNFQIGGWALCNTYVDDGKEALDYNASVNGLDHWKQAGDLAVNPRIAYAHKTYSAMNSTRNLIRKTHFLIKSLSLSYRIPPSICRPLHLHDATASLIVDNLYLWTPDQKAGKNSYKTYMYQTGMIRTISGELSFTF